MCAGRVRAIIDVCRTGDFRAFATFANGDEELCKRAGMPWVSHSYSWRGLSHLWGGEVAAALEQFETAVTLDPPDIWHGGDWGTLAMGRAYAGDREGALAICRDGLTAIDRGQTLTIGSLTRLLCHIETFAFLEQREEAASLYPIVAEATANAVLLPLDLRPVQLIAGIAAAAGGQWHKAQEHYETALRQAGELPIVIAQPEVRRWYAHTLIDRDAPGDRESARELLGDASAMYRKIGMPKHVELAEAMLREL
jgi:tetratricopeptide (TPR) repeat protein